MNELKATRGPWCTGTKARSMVFASDGLDFIVDCASGEFPPETERANAALIAAAPELYAALDEAETRIIELCGAYSHPLPLATMTRIRDVLKKARGE